MRKIKPTMCKICGETRTARGFSYHVSKSHGMKMSEYIIQHEFDGQPPTCDCGCGNNVTIRGNQVMDYIDGHCPKGHFKTGEAPRRNHQEWLVRTTEGIRAYNRKAKIKDPNYRKGSNNNFFNHKHSEKTKNLLRERVKDQIRSGNHAFLGNINGRLGKSNLEKKFERYISTLDLIYEHNFKVAYLNSDGHIRFKYYDFYIPIVNLLIEVHGSYWHPRNLIEDLSSMQKGNLQNDIFKRRLAKGRYYDILTIYDDELDQFIESNELTDIISESLTSPKDLVISGYIHSNVIELPDYWTKLVDKDSITVNLTPIGKTVMPSVGKITSKKITILGDDIDCFFMVLAERKDVEKLQVEI
jgi:hypothetical protein